jgi:hypothetical protein
MVGGLGFGKLFKPLVPIATTIMGTVLLLGALV